MREFAIEKMNMIVVHVKELDRSIRFYRDVLGLVLEQEEGGMAYFSIGTGQDKVSLMLHSTAEPEPADYGIGLDFQVDDAEAAMRLSEGQAERLYKSRSFVNGA